MYEENQKTEFPLIHSTPENPNCWMRLVGLINSKTNILSSRNNISCKPSLKAFRNEGFFNFKQFFIFLPP